MRILSVFLVLVLLGCAADNRPARVTVHGVSQGFGSAGAHAVQRGDTLYSIADRYQLRFEDLAAVNDLAAPYALDVGQRLKLPAPKEYRVRRGDTLFLISFMFEVDVDAVAEINNIDDPLRLRVGQVLTLPSVAQQRSIEVRDEEEDDAPVRLKPEHKPAPQDTQLAQKDEVIKPAKKPTTQKPAVRKPPKRTAKLKVDTPPRASSKFLKPVRGKIVSGYGPKKSGLYNS